MTRKQYKMIAFVLQEARDEGYGVNWITKQLSIKFALDNPEFNKDKFLKACGVEV